MYKYGNLLCMYMGTQVEESVIHSAIVGISRCFNDIKMYYITQYSLKHISLLSCPENLM